MKQFKELLNECHTGERYAIEDLLLRAAEFIRAEAAEQILLLNIAEADEESLREKTIQAKRESTVIFNGLVYAVNVVNRICIKHQRPVIYQGQEERRGYMELAMLLVGEMLLERT